MDLADSPAEATFRSEVRAFLKEHADKYPNRGRGFEEGDYPGSEAMQPWRDALVEKGWIAPHWPKEYGGAGLSAQEQFVLNEEFAEAGVNNVGGFGVMMIGPTLMVHGTEEQKQEHLTKILHGERNWAQGWSEPGAGSDLASLQTRAIRDGDEYVVNGQKIWTSLAHLADWLYVLARTDPDAPKHRGISFLLMDKHTPGISIRPLIDMGNRHHFNETFFEDVRVPVSNRVGEENRGWYVGMTLLDFERSNITGAVSSRRTLDELRKYLQTDEGKNRAPGYQQNRLNVAERYIETDVMFNFSFRIISMQDRGLIPNYEASVSKLFNSEMTQKIAMTGTRVFGLYGQIHDTEDKRAPMKAKLTQQYLTSVSSTIAAGTSEIQRNIIATRGLGLPRG